MFCSPNLLKPTSARKCRILCFLSPAQAKRSDILAYHGIKPTRALRPQMTSGMPSILMSSDRQPAVINMFVMPIESTQGVIVNGPAILMAFRKKATTTKV